ncbi:MAG: preprotein translocase subunit YajC [Verrucomicrobia bacterium]|nr:preprotein translocase subunit YajC [Verrucomicrobiota bacterium]
MNTLFLTILAADAPQESSPFGGILIPMVLMLVMMYFVMIRPQQKKQKEQTSMLDSLKIGDEIITAGGIHGIVSNKSDRTVTVKVQDGVKIKFEKSSVTQVFKSKDKGGKSTEVEAEVIEEEASSDKE